MKIIKRNGAEATFDISKIIMAITKANAAVEECDRMTPRQIQRIAGQDTACTHCDYLTVCHFTPGMGGDCHRVLTKLPADKVWSNLKGGTPDA